MKKIFISILTLVFISFVLVGCGSANEQNSNDSIKVAGSTSVSPLMKKIKIEYEIQNPDQYIEIQETGSSSGISSTISGASDIGMSSRELTKEEEDAGLVSIPICYEAIAVIVNPSNEVDSLTMEQLLGIYTGKITNWSEVGGSNETINVISREQGSGTRDSFEKKLGIQTELSEDMLYENSTGAVKTSVISDPNAIGYITSGSIDDNIKTVSIDGVYPDKENISNKTYPITSEYILCTMGEPTGYSKELIDFILSDEGQLIIEENNYVSIN